MKRGIFKDIYGCLIVRVQYTEFYEDKYFPRNILMLRVQFTNIYEERDFQTYGCNNIWLYGCNNIWLYGCNNIWLYGCNNIWLYGCNSIWLLCAKPAGELHDATVLQIPPWLLCTKPADELHDVTLLQIPPWLLCTKPADGLLQLRWHSPTCPSVHNTQRSHWRHHHCHLSTGPWR